MLLTITEALRLAAASQLLLMAALLLRDHRRSRVTVASSLLVGSVVCYLALPVLLLGCDVLLVLGPARSPSRSGSLHVSTSTTAICRQAATPPFSSDCSRPGPRSCGGRWRSRPSAWSS